MRWGEDTDQRALISLRTVGAEHQDVSWKLLAFLPGKNAGISCSTTAKQIDRYRRPVSYQNPLAGRVLTSAMDNV